MAKGVDEIVLPEGTKVPDHVALILDGNRRWARARGLQPWEGHKVGYEAVRRLARAARKMGVHTFTVWAFSTENWDRPEVERNEIMNLLRRALVELDEELKREQVRFVHLGRKDRFPQDIVKNIIKLESETRRFEDHVINLALDYGGRDEIVRAVRRVISEQLSVDQLDEKTFASYLDTADQPYPYVDLFIRTSGEQRTSGLLPWQMAYAEYYWEVDHLPDFSAEKLQEAVIDYSRRRRRFGGNDAEEHLKFDPKVMANLELKWRHALAIGEGETFRDLVVKYVREHYGLSKELAKVAGKSMASALIYGKKQDWKEARKALEGLYEIVRKTLGLALEPDLVANIEIDLWKGERGEEGLRQLLAEKFRFSAFQAGKAARLGTLAQEQIKLNNWDRAQGYLEKFYAALKERVA